MKCKHVSVTIRRTPKEVYGFASNPENLTKWAAGLARADVTLQGEDWIMDSPLGKIKVRFAPTNEYGVMDHDVTLPSGEVNHNPFRAVKNGDGTEVIFTVFRRQGMSEPDFARDADAVEADLQNLKALLERS